MAQTPLYRIGLALPPEEYLPLSKIAAKEGIPPAKVIRALIRERLDADDRRGKK